MAQPDVLQPDGFRRDAAQPHDLQGAICPACLLTLSRRLDETTQVQIAVNYATIGVSQCFSLCLSRTLPLCLPEPQEGFNRASFPATSAPSFQTSSLGLQRGPKHLLPAPGSGLQAQKARVLVGSQPKWSLSRKQVARDLGVMSTSVMLY